MRNVATLYKYMIILMLGLVSWQQGCFCEDVCLTKIEDRYAFREGHPCTYQSCAEACGFTCDLKKQQCVCSCKPNHACTQHTARCHWGPEKIQEKTPAEESPKPDASEQLSEETQPELPEERQPEEAQQERICSNGQTRPCYNGDPKTRNVGECKEGSQSCQNEAWGTCQGERVPSTEICNGKDDNCDGQTDELYPSLNKPCDVGLGQCKKSGQFVCKADGSGVECNVQPGQAGTEVCDGKDNDCDGQTDEELSCECIQEGETRSCYSGPSGTKNKGECKAGTQTCKNGKWGACQGEIKPQAESCNRKDDDCDGTIDNQPNTQEPLKQSCYTGPAGTEGKGICKAGMKTCSSGSWTLCAKEITPSTEVCNGKDDNCNGHIDEGTAPCVTTAAGDGKCHYDSSTSKYIDCYKDGPGTTAQFYGPTGVAADNAGNLFVADYGNNRIRKIDAQGNVTTIAGNGTAGYKDGPGTTAQFDWPQGIAVDSTGNLLVADTKNNRIRKIDTQGNVTTIAGSSTGGYKDGPGTTAQFYGPTGVAADNAGNLFITDYLNNRIRKIDAQGNVTTIAGNGTAGYKDGPGATAQFDWPQGIAVDSTGNLFVAGTKNNRIRKIDTQGNVTTIAGNGTAGYKDGPGTTAQFDRPTGLSVDAVGNLFITDSGNNRIRKIDAQGNVTTIAGNGTAGYKDGPGATAQFDWPRGTAIDSIDNLFVADSSNHRIRKVKLK